MRNTTTLSLPELYSVGEAARVLNRCVDSVRRYERDGRLPATRVGQVRVFRRSDVEQLSRELQAAEESGSR